MSNEMLEIEAAANHRCN